MGNLLKAHSEAGITTDVLGRLPLKAVTLRPFCREGRVEAGD